MLEALYTDADVFTLDRGIFDALVWNELLHTTGKITREEAEQVERFFTMRRWVDLIDVVFVMQCDPEVSIKREYADQLTTKRGTIMAEDTLRQFMKCIGTTLSKNGGRFKKTVTIDTTYTETRDGVKKIAAEALDALNGLLDEQIAVVPVSSINVPESGFVTEEAMISAFVRTVETERRFVPRSEAESNPGMIQPIPCGILRYEDKVLVLKRKKPGHPLHDTYVLWAGGHVSATDDGPEILIRTLERELSEEVFIKEAFELNPTPVGLLRTNEDARASRHIGVLYEITLKSEDVALAMNQKEFRETRGSSMSGRLVAVHQLAAIYDKMRDWSKQIVDHYWPAQVPRPAQPLFENWPVDPR